MNTIKYRQWLKYGRFHYWGYLKEDIFIAPCGPNDAAAPSEKFTGLTDINGKEIYEGDVVEDSKGRGEVLWVQEHCSFLVAVAGGFFRLENGNAEYRLTETEVIGNIHENPELLESPDA